MGSLLKFHLSNKFYKKKEENNDKIEDSQIQ